MRIVRIGVIVLSLLFMSVAIVAEWDKLQATPWSVRPWWLAVSFVALVALFFLDAYGWHLVLKALGHDVPAGRTMQAWLVSSLARYIPGGIWSYTSRVALAKAEGVDVASASVSLYIETLLLMWSSLAIGSIALLYGAGLAVDAKTLIGICMALGIMLHPGVLKLLRKLPGALGRAMQAVRLPSARHMIGLYVYYLVFWVLFGAVFVGFVQAVHPVAPSHWLLVGAGISLSFFVGFVAIFAPGGIGVRESTLYVLLIAALPAGASLAISIGSRLWIMAAEAVSVMLILVLMRVLRQEAAQR